MASLYGQAMLVSSFSRSVSRRNSVIVPQSVRFRTGNRIVWLPMKSRVFVPNVLALPGNNDVSPLNVEDSNSSNKNDYTPSVATFWKPILDFFDTVAAVFEFLFRNWEVFLKSILEFFRPIITLVGIYKLIGLLCESKAYALLPKDVIKGICALVDELRYLKPTLVMITLVGMTFGFGPFILDFALKRWTASISKKKSNLGMDYEDTDVFKSAIKEEVNVPLVAVCPLKDHYRCLRCPRALLPKNVPTALTQFNKSLDENLAAILVNMLLKYQPEGKTARKERLLKRPQALADRKAPETEKHIVVQHGLNHVTYLIKQNIAQLVVIAHDVDPIELLVWLPALCRKMEIPYCIVKGKARLGTIVHKKTASVLCLTTVNNEDKMEFSKKDAIKAYYNDKDEEHSKEGGGGIMGPNISGQD